MAHEEKKVGYILMFTWLRATRCKRVTGETIWATTTGCVANHIAHSLISTLACTWVLAFFVDTCLTQGAVRVDSALRFTAMVRVS